MSSEPFDLWHLTVVRTHGLRLMHPEKTWRPVVTLEVDEHHIYETVLGTDGQSINQKETFTFRDVTANSVLDIKVWHRSQTKKKGKRKKLVASSTGHPLGVLVRKQESDHKVEIRLQCQTPKKNTNASRGKPQNGAVIILRVKPPLSFSSLYEKRNQTETVDYSDTESSSDTIPTPPSSLDPVPTPPPLEGLRRRLKAYKIYSDDDTCEEEEEEEEKNVDQGQSLAEVVNGDDDVDDEISEAEDSIIYSNSTLSHAIETVYWIAGSVLPQYTERLVVPPTSLNPAERLVSTFTLYSELKEAELESDYQPIFERLQKEWQYIGGLLAALAAVNAAVFAISPDSLFEIQPYALSAIAGSSIASGLGMAIDAWFLFRYNWVDLKTFIFRARDVYHSYFFFALSARMPAVCMLFSTLCLMAFLGLVAFQKWPQGVLIICFFAGVVMSLQFLVFGMHWCMKGVVKVVQKVTIKS